ncbi:DsbA family protein [Methylocella sp. CPCC 101449]|uniref:DsbA family protein n=1 Tax=Methylocella sp. CPCC 101449 TaxID=2987531 RepID=UPI002890C368|nr:DsbA family protein [Methylocella sp. CPCC 101449]MDT2022332.1 DsbA family protein [Methylocella sp. CPCC 101449]
MRFLDSTAGKIAAFAVVALLAFGVGILARSPSVVTPTTERAQVEAIIKDYLLKNPDVMRLALEEMERHTQAQEETRKQESVAKLSPQIFQSKYQTVLGNPDGKIQLVEFFDYNCGYCKRALNDLSQLMKDNPDLRIILKEFPVLGPGSVEAAQVAMALKKQIDPAKYWEFHQKLLGGSRGPVGKAQALAVAEEAGADLDKLQADMAGADVRAGLGEVMNIAETLGLNGTPSYIVGSEIVVGAVGAEKLQDKISNLRKCGKTDCI